LWLSKRNSGHFPISNLVVNYPTFEYELHPAKIRR